MKILKWLGIASTILAIALICSEIFAQVAKVSDTEYSLTQSVVTKFSLLDRKNTVAALEKDIERKQAEIAQLTQQVADINKEIQDAEGLGVKETVTAIDGGSK